MELSDDNFRLDRLMSGARREGYWVSALMDNDLSMLYFDNSEEATEYIEETENKCYLISIEYAGFGDYEVKCTPHT